MIHEMKLNAAPFLAIKSGGKTVEMRLNDEKRALIKVGDQIQFCHAESGEKLLCNVVALYPYNNFDELYRCHDKISIGYKENEVANPSDMLAYYPAEKIAYYGVLGIGIEVIK
ncbi:MAG: RNA-binding protein [Clostridia bacterium]|nr:RNA-binding protein [Clostridia bacterium]